MLRKMAMSCGRAASCSSSLITRYARANRSSSFPPLLRRPFSTDKSPEFPYSKSESSNKVSLAEDGVSYPNLGDKIDTEIASYSNEGTPKRMASPLLGKMAMSCGVVRRAASCSSSLITRYARAPLANRSPGSSSFPFSTSSADNPETPEFPYSKSDRAPLLDGLPFDSIKLERFGTLALQRKTKDELIEIKVREDYDRTEKCECLWMYVKINYGKEFKKCMKFDIISLPDDPDGRFVIRNVTMSVDDDNLEEVHVDEMEGFLEKRGINNDILEFIVKYAEERRANLKYGDYVNN